ncbi:hypothetical protein L7F22_043043 [Adiantum nelumboides]|nr:hypothetical protein [Adiantum nelumboides]
MAFFERAYRMHESKGRLSGLLAPVRVEVEVMADGLPPPDASTSFTDLFQVTPSMPRNLLLLLHSLSAQQQPATCLVSDSILAWTQHVADQMGIPRVEFWTASATAYLIVLALPHLIRQGFVGSHNGEAPKSWKGKEPLLLDCVLGHTGFPLDEVPTDFRYASLEDPLLQRFIEAANLVNKANCLFIHSTMELEPQAFHALQDIGHIEAYSIGPLIDQSIDAMPTNPTLTWLDTKSPASVIYVSFGSTVVHTEDEIVEIACGLEASDGPFLWVIRSDGLLSNKALIDMLPIGFHLRTANRGMIVPWVDQLDVLAHPALGGFLTHCGWNSTLESLWMGVPLLTCPMRADQPINNRLIVREWGVGLELHCSSEGGKPNRKDIEVGIKELIHESSGHLARARAKEFKTMLRKSPSPGHQSHTNLLHFATTMKKLC